MNVVHQPQLTKKGMGRDSRGPTKKCDLFCMQHGPIIGDKAPLVFELQQRGDERLMEEVEARKVNAIHYSTNGWISIWERSKVPRGK